jgi:hypothetical protein
VQHPAPCNAGIAVRHAAVFSLAAPQQPPSVHACSHAPPAPRHQRGAGGTARRACCSTPSTAASIQTSGLSQEPTHHHANNPHPVPDSSWEAIQQCQAVAATTTSRRAAGHGPPRAWQSIQRTNGRRGCDDDDTAASRRTGPRWGTRQSAAGAATTVKSCAAARRSGLRDGDRTRMPCLWALHGPVSGTAPRPPLVPALPTNTPP